MLPAELGLPQPVSFVVSPVYFNTYGLNLSVQQPIFTGFRLEARAAAARHGLNAVIREKDKANIDFDFSIKRAYGNLIRARESLGEI